MTPAALRARRIAGLRVNFGIVAAFSAFAAFPFFCFLRTVPQRLQASASGLFW